MPRIAPCKIACIGTIVQTGPDSQLIDFKQRRGFGYPQPEEVKAHAKSHGFYPVEIEGSVTNELWKRYMRPKEEILTDRKKAETVDDLEPEIRDTINRALRELDKR
jgi:hypothetical protein